MGPDGAGHLQLPVQPLLAIKEDQRVVDLSAIPVIDKFLGIAENRLRSYRRGWIEFGRIRPATISQSMLMLGKISHVVVFLFSMTFLVFLSVPPSLRAEGIGDLKKGVVRITAQVEGTEKVGTGFIVKLDPDIAYIVTVAHVVAGDERPKVQFFIQQDVRVQATVKHSEGGDEVTGLALLIVRGKQNLPSGLTALPLASAVRFSGAEDIMLIGHPRGAGDWTPLRVRIASQQGRYVTVDANIDEGNSGGPILQNGQVVGLVGGVTRYGRGVTSGSVGEYLEGHGISIQKAEAPTKSPASLEYVKGTGCYTYGDNETPTQAKRAATALAQEQAVRSHRAFVQSESKVKNFQLEEELIQTASAAMLENIQVEEEQKAKEICVTITAKISPHSMEELIRQRVNAKEISQAAESSLVPKNASFGLRLWTNKRDGHYVEGDHLIIYVQATREGYLKLDYFQADGSVVHLVPNKYHGQEYMKAGQTYTFGDDAAPEQFVIDAPFGNETIKAILSLRPIEVGSDETNAISDSRDYLRALQLRTRGVKVQATEESVSLVTTSKVLEDYKKDRLPGTSTKKVP